MTDNQIIDHIENSLRNHNLSDIKEVSKSNMVIASFILCSCFIEQVSGFRYAVAKKQSGKLMFEKFVKDYLQKYDSRYNPEKLRTDLRNKLVHNYSIGDSYSLTMRSSNSHFQLDPNGRVKLNLENFLNDLEKAFNLWTSELRNVPEVKQNALKWYTKHNILAQIA